jgi:hypothetical protein
MSPVILIVLVTIIFGVRFLFNIPAYASFFNSMDVLLSVFFILSSVSTCSFLVQSTSILERGLLFFFFFFVTEVNFSSSLAVFGLFLSPSRDDIG